MTYESMSAKIALKELHWSGAPEDHLETYYFLSMSQHPGLWISQLRSPLEISWSLYLQGSPPQKSREESKGEKKGLVNVSVSLKDMNLLEQG